MREDFLYDSKVYMRVLQNNRVVYLIWWDSLVRFVEHINLELEFLSKVLEAEKQKMDRKRAEVKIRNEINSIQEIDKL